MSCFPVILFCRVYKNISDAGAHCGKTAGSLWRAIHDYNNVAETKKIIKQDLIPDGWNLITPNRIAAIRLRNLCFVCIAFYSIDDE